MILPIAISVISSDSHRCPKMLVLKKKSLHPKGVKSNYNKSPIEQ